MYYRWCWSHWRYHQLRLWLKARAEKPLLLLDLLRPALLPAHLLRVLALLVGTPPADVTWLLRKLRKLPTRKSLTMSNGNVLRMVHFQVHFQTVCLVKVVEPIIGV